MNVLAKSIIFAALATVFAVNAEASTASLNTGSTDIIVNPSGGSFTDIYNIVLGSVGTIDYTVTVINQQLNYPTSFAPLTFSTVDIFKFQDGSFNYGLYNASNTKILDPVNLAAGSYTLKISGITTGLYGGEYELKANISAVPEPETGAMIGLGLGIIGLISIRRKI